MSQLDKKIREAIRLKYARGRKEVEKEILYSSALAGQSLDSKNERFQGYLYPF